MPANNVAVFHVCVLLFSFFAVVISGLKWLLIIGIVLMLIGQSLAKCPVCTRSVWYRNDFWVAATRGQCPGCKGGRQE